ncbi:MAG TPA: hypothetical protein VHN15_02505, partial [Thermoanaerobaculia bacterium]|nr:hypothetical protein [Thermoanaerobaculia bacterium]
QAQREQARRQQVRVDRQQRSAGRQQAQVRQQRIENRRQAQIRQQRIENQRLAQVRQQQIAAQRQAEIRRQRDLQIARERSAARRYNDRYAYDNRYTQNRYRGRGGADRSVIAADGILHDNGRCLVLRGHQGQVYSLVGGTGGLREGEHVRLVGRLLYDNDGCGEMMDVHQVQAIWADPNHRQTYFDHQRDGSFNNSYRQRYGDRYYDRYEDDYRYDDYYYEEDYPR